MNQAEIKEPPDNCEEVSSQEVMLDESTPRIEEGDIIPPRARYRRKGDITRFWFTVLLVICVAVLLGVVYYQRMVIVDYRQKYESGEVASRNSNNYDVITKYSLRIIRPLGTIDSSYR